MRQGERAVIGKLVLWASNRVLREIVIDRKRLSIGRRAYNDLMLDDLTVSGEHAIVHSNDGESVIHDLKSRNGTLVNGSPIMQQTLADGDNVDIGIYRLVYRLERIDASRGLAALRGQSVVDPVAPAAPGMQDGPASTSPTGYFRGNAWVPRNLPPTSPASATPAPPVFDGRPASIRFLGGHDAGRHMVLDRPIVSIRNGNGQVAVIARRNSGYFLTHLEGLAYPLVNGESIGLGAHALRDNDLIELAGTIIQFSG